MLSGIWRWRFGLQESWADARAGLRGSYAEKSLGLPFGIEGGLGSSTGSGLDVPSKKTSDDRTVVELKLQTVNRYVEVFESSYDRIHSAMLVAVCNPANDAEDILATLRKAVETEMSNCVANSLIAADLDAARASLGEQFQTAVEQLWQSFHSRARKIIGLRSQPGADTGVLASETRELAAVVIELLVLTLAPAMRVRSTLVECLNAMGCQERRTPLQRAKALRNERIRELFVIHPTASPAKLAKFCEQDQQIQNIGQLCNAEIIRNVLRPRTKRGKMRG